MAGHVAPEAAHRGPIAALRDGDEITFDITNRTLERKYFGRRDREPPGELDGAGAALHAGRYGEVRRARLLCLRGSRHHPRGVPELALHVSDEHNGALRSARFVFYNSMWRAGIRNALERESWRASCVTR